MAEGPLKEAALLELCQCFHGYLMKYLVMICRGHVPMWGNRINRDVEPFIKYFLPKGAPVNQSTVGIAVRHFHLAFKGMGTEEIYAVLMEQLVAAIGKYDPEYTKKVKLVVETIDGELSKQNQFSVADVGRHLELDCDRYIRLLCRRGFLAAVKEKRKRITGFRRTDAWPPPAAFFESGAIGITYYLQTWFRFYLQQWIDESMSRLVCSLIARHWAGAGGNLHGREDVAGRALPRADGHHGRQRTGVASVPQHASPALHRASKRIEVVGRGLRKFVECRQQILGAHEIHAQASGLQTNSLGQLPHLSPGHIRWDGQRYGGGLMVAPQLLQRFGQPLAPAPFQNVFRAGLQRLELPQQLEPVHEQRLARLEAGKEMHELYGAPAPHAEDPLEDGPVDHRHVQGRQLLANLCKS